MRRDFFKSLLALFFVMCGGFSTAFATKPSFKVISVKELKGMLADPKANVKIYDANGDKTRKDQGTVPNAVLLPSHDAYEFSLLPTDKKAQLVFYCASEKCTASHDAANRATGAGYEKVFVLGPGIKGWNQENKAHK